jgi:hypothetical protein
VPAFREIEKSHERVEEEFVRERAAALRRIGGRLEELVTELVRYRTLAAQLEGEGRERARAAFNRVRAEAGLYRWYLEVQREAVGVRGHGRLDEIYPMPAALEREP